MVYGITALRAHLDRLGAPAREEGEIAWDELALWIADHSEPSFAGRYFLGTATADEVEAGLAAGAGFCLWAHGEGADASAPKKIVPLQRADRERQVTAGELGASYGVADASALGRYLDLCLAVGDLEIVDTKQILVFLEVADGTALSLDYWAAWATTLHDFELANARHADRAGGAAPMLQPLIGGICCAFPFDEVAQSFLPDSGVRACLDQKAPPGKRSHCHGFWARKLSGDPALATHLFDWANLGEYRQPREILGISPAYMQRVPVRYLRWFDSPEGLDIPEGTLRETLSLLTLDWAASDGDDPTGATFTATGWRADAVVGDVLTEMPVQFGVDKNRDLTSKTGCLTAAGVVVAMLPSAYAWEDGTGAPFEGTLLAAPLLGTCTVAFRYYSSTASTNSKDLKAAEARALSAAGFQVVVVWEAASSSYQDIADHVVAFEQGKKDALRAFACAADTIGQPPYTPVYFAVDFPVGAPDYGGVAMPPLEDVIRYFQDVHRGYREYLETHPDSPYYIGIYGQADMCAELYRAGLATHFWQPWPPNWGANWRPFAHANAWQIVLENTLPHPSFPNMLTDNAALMACTSVDIDVAWGDPGGFQVF